MLATQNVNVTIARDTSIRSGTDRVKHLAMVAALNPVQPGSSISHWDTAGIPNQLMERRSTPTSPPRCGRRKI